MSDPTTEQDHNEIIPDNPGFFTSYGIYFLLAFFTTIFIISIFVPFSTRIRSRARLTTINSPKPLISKENIKLTALKHNEGDLVKRGDLIGELETTAKLQSIVSLEHTLRGIVTLIEKGSEINIDNSITRYTDLGELQNDYQEFIKSEILFEEVNAEKFDKSRLRLLQLDLRNLKYQNTILEKQHLLKIKDGKLSEEGFVASRQLREEKVLSPQEYRNEESKLISKNIPVTQIELDLSSNLILQNEKFKEIQSLDEKFFEATRTYQHEIFSLLSKIEAWKSRFLIIAPIDGKLAFTHVIEANIQLSSNEILGYIVPGSDTCYAEIIISQTNFGKVAAGQQVFIKLNSYPYAEYGALTGKIDHIATIPTDSGYISRVILSNGLTTSLKKNIPYKEGLTGYADIIIKDQNLLTSIFLPVLRRD